MEEIFENIYRIGVPLPHNPLRELNSYFIRGTDRDLLIDTGFRMQECKEALQSGLDELGSDPARRAVYCTHIHADHCGMADWFAGADMPIYMNVPDLNYYNKMVYRNIAVKTNGRFLREGFPADLLEQNVAGNPARKLNMDFIDERFCSVKDGDEITAGEYTLKVISVPGHTPGNSMLWDEAHKIMFTGDHILFDITPNITAFAEETDMLGSYLNSLKRADAYPVQYALPGHRKTGDYHERIHALLAHHERRMQEVVDIVNAHPGWTAYQIASKMTWKIRSADWESFPLAQKWFAVGECFSHVDHLCITGKIFRGEEDGLVRYYPV